MNQDFATEGGGMILFKAVECAFVVLRGTKGKSPVAEGMPNFLRKKLTRFLNF